MNTTPSRTADHDGPPRLRGRVVAFAFVAVFILRFGYLYLGDLARARVGTFDVRFLEELTAIVPSIALFYGVAWLEREWPLDAGRWRLNWLRHVAGLVGYSVLHTTVIAASRMVVFPAVGMGSYDYGILSLRYPMEAGQDVVSYASFIAVLTLLRIQARLQREQLRAATLGRDAAQARLEALNLRLQPHFLFNALNTISSAVYTSPAAADAMIAHLGDLLRHALRTGDRPEVSLAEELEALAAYLSFVDARFGDRIECDLQVESGANAIAIPAFLLQPLVENAVHHCSAVEGCTSRVTVRISTVESSLLLLVENDYDAAMTPRARGMGIGLRTTRERLRLIYGDDHEFHAGPFPGTARFSVRVRIPARPAQAEPPATPASASVSYASADR